MTISFLGVSPEWETWFVLGLSNEVDIGEVEEGTFMYAGLKISTNSEEMSVSVDLNGYIEEIEPISIDPSRNPSQAMSPSELSSFRGLVGGMLWAATQVRPDMGFSVSELAGFTAHPLVEHLVKANQVLKKMKALSYKLVFKKLNFPLRMVVYTDASFGNRPDGGSQGGVVVGLAEDCVTDSAWCPLLWSSRKLRRVSRSTLGCETLAMVDGVDEGLALAYLCDEILGKACMVDKSGKPTPLDLICRKSRDSLNIPLDAVTDCKSLFDHINKNKKGVSEKRLIIDLWSLREDLSKGTLRSISWCRTDDMIADVLTKGTGLENLVASLKSGILPPLGSLV